MDADARWRPPLSDVVVAASFAALSVSLTLGVLDTAGERLVGVTLGVLHSGALVARRRWPSSSGPVILCGSTTTSPLT